MRGICVVGALTIGLACVLGDAAQSASPVSKQRDGSLAIAGRILQCSGVRNVLDSRVPNLGLAVPDRRLLIINPALLRSEPETVRLFVFNHECGHHHVGGDELAADCWAVKAGVREGWLNKAGLEQVCKSFRNAPETATHPSGRRRCAALDRCYGSVLASLPPAQRSAAASQSSGTGQSSAPIGAAVASTTAAWQAPRLVAAPKLVRTGISRGEAATASR